MLCKFFESFEDIHRSSPTNDDSSEVHISDSEEDFPKHPKKSTSIKKTSNADILPKTLPCDYNLAVKEWSFYKTETAKLLENSSELQKLNSREKKRPVQSLLDTSKNLEDSNRKENLPQENRVSLNLSRISENELSVCEQVDGNSMLLEIQNLNSLPQSVSVGAKRYLPIKKSSKFSADSDLLSGVQMTPRVKKIKPQLLKDVCSDVFINHDIDFKKYQAKCPAMSKNASVSDMQPLTTPKVKRIMLPQTCNAKTNVSHIVSGNFAECDSVYPNISKDTNSFIDCSFLSDPGMTSKVKKVKVEGILNDDSDRNIFSDVSMNFEVLSQDVCPEISESSGSMVKGSVSQSAVNEDCDISDYSDNVYQNRKSLDRNAGEENHDSRQSFENMNDREEGTEDSQKIGCFQNMVSMHKGSDFVKSIKLHQELAPKTKKELEVHTEKRKKYLPGGFAEQAQKLEYREKSSIVLWSYQKNNEAGLVTKRYLSLKIHSFSVVCSFVITKCEILKDSSISVEQNDKREPAFNYVFQRNGTKGELKKEHLSKHVSSQESCSDFKDYVCSNVSDRRRERYKDCLVAVKLKTWDKLKLTTDAVIRIFPPWQTLWIDSLNIYVLLCTYFMEVLSTLPAVEKSPSEKVLYSTAASCTKAVLSTS